MKYEENNLTKAFEKIFLHTKFTNHKVVHGFSSLGNSRIIPLFYLFSSIKMHTEDKQILLTTAWLFMQHGQNAKAFALCRQVNEQEPEDGICAALLAQLLLEDYRPKEALDVISNAVFPQKMDRVAALLEARALKATGDTAAGEQRWKKYLENKSGRPRKWVVDK